MIKEVIVVEGKDDVQAVKRAVECEVIITKGFVLSKETIARIKKAKERQGIIVLTDPDYVGEQLRRRIDKAVPGCKHAFLPRGEATLKGDIGVENASVDSIRAALKKARCKEEDRKEEFNQATLIEHGLMGTGGAQELREKLGRELGIGYGNGKQFLSRLNNYGISRAEFVEAIEKISGKGSVAANGKKLN